MKQTLRAILVALGKALGALSRPVQSDLCMFFNAPVLGGAETVHAEIVSAVSAARPEIRFTDNPVLGRQLESRFCLEGARVTYLTSWTGNRLFFYFCVGVMACKINRRPGVTFFCGHSYFAYRLIPYLAAHVRVIDIVHTTGTGLDRMMAGVAARVNRRVAVNESVRQSAIQLAGAEGASEGIESRIEVIANCVDIPAAPQPRNSTGLFRLLYVGRASDEKRIDLAAKVARSLAESGLEVRLTLVGPSVESVIAQDREACEFTGEIVDRARLEKLYDNAHALLLLSAREGGPLVVAEAMARGTVPVCTDVGGVPGMIEHGRTGILIHYGSDEQIVQDAVREIQSLADNRTRLHEIALAAHESARTQFSRGRFESAWRRVLMPESAEPLADPA